MHDPLLERLRRALAPEFEIDSRLGSGGMGLVYLGREMALDRPVAVKVLRPEMATAVARERFLKEARLLARLQHPNIVPVHRADERDGLQFYVMDFIAGGSLADRLATGRYQGDLTRLGHDLLRALGAAHGAGIIHRDVKPHNLFFVRGRALLGDFGIARDDHQSEGELTGEGLLLGTREYMAPEQLLGEPATERSDQYSGAAVLYQAACGRPWRAGTPPAEADWRGVPGPMAKVLRRALAVDPARRWGSMWEVRKAFDRAGLLRQVRAGIIAIVLVGGGALAWSVLHQPAPARTHRSLAILPFRTVGLENRSLGAEIAEGTDINLAWFPSLGSRVPHNRVAGWMREHPDADPIAALAGLDVDHVVSGVLERRGDGLLLRLVLTDSGGSVPLPVIGREGNQMEPGALGELAALAIGARLGSRPGTDMRNLASRSPEAAGLYLQGEELFDNDEWDAAAGKYQEAVGADPSFALARWRHLVAEVWARRYSWEEAAELAACCAGDLPPLENGLVRAMGEPDLLTRFAAFDSLDRQYADVSLFLLLYASEQFHRGPLLGRELSGSLDLFEKAIGASRQGPPLPAYDHLVWGSTRLGNREAAREWLASRKRLNAEARVKSAIVEFLQLGYDFRWVPWRARARLWAIDRWAGEGDLQLLAGLFRFSATWDLPEAQDAVGRVVASRLLTTDRASGLEARGLARLTWGEVGPGLAYLDSAAALFRTEEAELQRRQWRLLLPVLGAGRATEAEEAAARAWLADAAVTGPPSARAQWTLVLDAVQQGDTSEAQAMAVRLEEAAGSDSSSARLSVLAAAILDGSRDPRRALARTDALLGRDSPAPGNDVFSRSILHLSRAAWFEAIGDREAALAEILWYENSDAYRYPVHEAQKMEVDAVASVPARLTRGRLLLAAGDTARACGMLSRVRQIWRKADASLAAPVARADSLYRGACR